VNASFDGGQTWTATLPNGFIPGVTRFKRSQRSGTGFFDAGGDDREGSAVPPFSTSAAIRRPAQQEVDLERAR